MKPLIRPFVVLAVLLISSAAWAIDCTVVVAATATLTCTYTEPTTNLDSTALDDLSHTNVFHQIDTGTVVKSPDLLANLRTGGQVKSYSFTVTVPQNQRVTVNVWATATDLSGNVSADSVKVAKVVDRLPPLPPT